MKYSEYKVIEVAEGGCSTILLGGATLPIKKLQEVLNQELKNGWHLVFQVLERKRLLLFWTRESIILTLGKSV